MSVVATCCSTVRAGKRPRLAFASRAAACNRARKTNMLRVTTICVARSRRSPRQFVAGISAAATFALPTPSDGQPTDAGWIDVQWEAPSECPDARSVKAYAERLLGHPVEIGHGQRVGVQARVRRNSLGNWELRFAL